MVKVVKEEFKKALDLAKLAIVKNHYIKGLSHFYFSEGQEAGEFVVIGFNGRTLVSAATTVPITGYVPADTLLDLVSALPEVFELEDTDTHLIIKNGKSKTKIAKLQEDCILPLDTLEFTDDEIKEQVTFAFSEPVASGLAQCLNTVNKTAAIENQYGVTFGDGNMYSTDNKRMSVVNEIIPKCNYNIMITEELGKILLKTRSTLSTLNAVIEHSKSKLHASFSTEEGVVCSIVSTLPAVTQFIAFKDIFEKNYGIAKYLEIPPALRNSIKTAEAISKKNIENAVNLQVDKNVLEIHCASQTGEYKDTIEFSSETLILHEKIKIIDGSMFDLSLVKSALELGTHFAIHTNSRNNATVFSVKDEAFRQIIASLPTV